MHAVSLPVRTTGVGVDPELRSYVRQRLQAQFASYAVQIQASSVRFDPEKTRRGGADMVCRIRVQLKTMQPTIVTEASARAPEAAFDEAAVRAFGELRRLLKQPNVRGRKTRGRGEATSSKAPLIPKDSSNTRLRQVKRRASPQPDEGSLVGRRVGRAAANVEGAAARPEKQRRNVDLDTAQPRLTETDRRVGAGSTAARNTKQNMEGMTSTLEDSAKLRPSRRSTRRSANNAKRDGNLRIRQVNRVHSPPARASRQ